MLLLSQCLSYDALAFILSLSSFLRLSVWLSVSYTVFFLLLILMLFCFFFILCFFFLLSFSSKGAALALHSCLCPHYTPRPPRLLVFSHHAPGVLSLELALPTSRCSRGTRLSDIPGSGRAYLSPPLSLSLSQLAQES